MRKPAWAIAALAVLVIAACGGSSGSSGSGESAGGSPKSLEDVLGAVQGLDPQARKAELVELAKAEGIVKVPVAGKQARNFNDGKLGGKVQEFSSADGGQTAGAGRDAIRARGMVLKV